MNYEKFTCTWSAPEAPDVPGEVVKALEPYYGKDFDITWSIEPADRSVGIMRDGVGDVEEVVSCETGETLSEKETDVWPSDWWEKASEEANEALHDPDNWVDV